MYPLRICLFGDLYVACVDRVLTPFPTQNASWLFAYLVLHRDRPVHRDVVCGTLWGERSDADARKTLRTALWRVRNAIEKASGSRGSFLRVERRHLQLRGPAWVDVEEFEECLRRPSSYPPLSDSGMAARLARAASLYRAELLEGIYADWCQSDRERLRLAYLTTLERLMEHRVDRAEWREAIAWGARLLRHDRVREHVHRRVMLCHLANGDRPSALRHYEECRRALREELGIEPMEETRLLYERIREGVA